MIGSLLTDALVAQEDYGHYVRGEAGAVSPDVQRVTGANARSVGDFADDYADAFKNA